MIDRRWVLMSESDGGGGLKHPQKGEGGSSKQ